MLIHKLYLATAGALLAVAAVGAASSTTGPRRTPTVAVVAGPGTFQVPRWLPEHTRLARADGGEVLLGEMDERELCFEHFVGIYWSRAPIPDEALAPAPAYHRVPPPAGARSDPKDAPLTRLYFRAVKPCGRVIEAELAVHRGVCPGSGAHYAVTGIVDPVLGPGLLATVVRSLRCS